MIEYRVAVVIGSLRRDSYNRKLANAVTKLAPEDFSFHDLRIDDLPLYNQDDDGNQAEQVKRLKSEITGSQGLLFVDTRVQSVDTWRTEECDRPCLAALWSERVGGKTCRRDWNLTRCSGNQHGSAASAEHSGLLGRTDPWSTRSFHSSEGWFVWRERRYRRPRHKAVSAGLDGPLCRLGKEVRHALRAFY